jgi:hypothetical protein
VVVERERGMGLDAMEERWKWIGEVIVCVCRGADGAAFRVGSLLRFSLFIHPHHPFFGRLVWHLLSDLYCEIYASWTVPLCSVVCCSPACLLAVKFCKT